MTAVRPPEHGNFNSCNLQETLNISDSYNDNDNGNETRKVQVNFQWIRPHPALFLQAQPASTSTSTSTSSCVEASKIVNAHARKRLKRSFQIQNSAKRSAYGLLESSGSKLESELESDSGTTRRRRYIRNETFLPINDSPEYEYRYRYFLHLSA